MGDPSGILQGRYKTPDTSPTETVCRALNIPDDDRLITAVSEVIGLLTRPEVWQEVGITPDEAAALAAEVVVYEECETVVQPDITRMWVEYSEPDGNSGQSIPINTPTAVPYSVLRRDGDPANMQFNVTNSRITLEPGQYTIRPTVCVFGANHIQLSLATDPFNVLAQVPGWINNRLQNNGSIITLQWDVEVINAGELWVEVYCRSGTNPVYGAESAEPGNDEIFAQLSVTRWGD